MSFGDDQGPVQRLFTGAVSRFDAVLGPAFAGRFPTPAKTPDAPAPPSLVNKPMAPVSQDTPGRHKSLLGA